MKPLVILVLLAVSFSVKSQAPSSSPTAFDEAIDSRFKSDEPGGIALVAKDGKIIYQRAFGMANLEANIPMKSDMLFSIGSMGKQFTAVCILKLMEQGKLKLSDPINTYFMDCPKSWAPVTIEHLLTHTSGITDAGRAVNKEAIEVINEYQDKALTFSPGSKWSYSSTGYAILGFILEKVSGMRYQDYLRKNIINPLQLSHTYLGDESEVIPDLTNAYLGSRGRYRHVTRKGLTAADGGGGLLSTPADILKWTEALIAGKVIKKETLAKAWTSYVLADGTLAYYGYGWWTGWKIKESPMVNHGGLAGGYTSDAVYLPNERIYAAVFMNTRGVLTDLVTDDLVAVALGKISDLITTTLPDNELESYTGVYVNRDSSQIKITLKDHQLYYERGGVYELAPLAKTDQFFVNNTLAICIFKRDNNRQIIGLYVANKRNIDVLGEMFNKTTLPFPETKTSSE